jgi:hypothetical protein
MKQATEQRLGPVGLETFRIRWRGDTGRVTLGYDWSAPIHRVVGRRITNRCTRQRAATVFAAQKQRHPAAGERHHR